MIYYFGTFKNTSLLKSNLTSKEKEIKAKKQKEKENIDIIKSKYLPDSKPIYITVKDHNIEQFIYDLEKAVFC